MTDLLANIEIIDLSETEAKAIWKRQTKLSEQFPKILAYIQARGVGASFDVACAKIAGEDKSEEYATEAKHNFNEAAKQRTAYRTLAPAGTALDTVVKPDDAVGDPFVAKDGTVQVEVPAPVVIRWKVQSHTAKRTVQDGPKKKEIEIKVVDFLHGLIVANDSIQRRGPRAESEQVDALIEAQALKPADAKAGTKVKLADGREAVMTKAGHWRAPKNAATGASSTPSASTDAASTLGSANGTTERPDGTVAPETVGAAT